MQDDRTVFWHVAVVGLLSFGLAEASLSWRLGPRAGIGHPGVRSGAPGAGGFLSGLSTDEVNFATAAQTNGFDKQWSVRGTIPGAPTIGLGPRFIAWGCSSCHSQPAVGGSSPANNNEYIQATAWGARNTIPSFITANGPTRIPYMNKTFGGYSAGTLLKLYTITGRIDAAGCNIAQPDFATLVANNALSYHIPVPLFGGGLVEATPSTNLINAQDLSRNTSLGITSGRFNSTVRGIQTLGWKATTAGLDAFAASALSTDLDTTSQIYPKKEDDTVPSCLFNSLPEDAPSYVRRTPNTNSASADYASDVTLTAQFVRSLAPPTPACTPVQGSSTICYGTVTQSSIYNGQQKFIQAGCDACHILSQTTGSARLTGQSNLTYYPLSDYALHNMGAGLWDGITSGAAGPQDFRTPALWGVGQRIWLLHDGRTADLYQSILAHSSTGSEANTTVSNFNLLSVSDQQDILNYLRSF